MDSKEIIVAILRGDADDRLGEIEQATRGRKRSAFRPGTKFTLKNLSPRYMIGVKCTVQAVKEKRISVTIDPEWVRRNPGKRFATNEPVSVTADMLEPINESVSA